MNPSNAPFVSETHYLVSSGDGTSFWLQVEPEGMSYDFPPNERILLTVKARTPVQHVALVHLKDGLALWRPGDAEVWATLADGTHEQIGGFSDNPAPGLDAGSAMSRPPPWDWPPVPPAQGP